MVFSNTKRRASSSGKHGHPMWIIPLLAACLLTSCAAVVNDAVDAAIEGKSVKSRILESALNNTVGTSIQRGIQNLQKKEADYNRSQQQSAKRKEQQSLIEAGKCPICKGMGKSADGQYTCSACNGTGMYKEELKQK